MKAEHYQCKNSTMPTARNARAIIVGTTCAATCRSSTKRKMLRRSETANLAPQTVAGYHQRRTKTRRGSITLATKPLSSHMRTRTALALQVAQNNASLTKVYSLVYSVLSNTLPDHTLVGHIESADAQLQAAERSVVLRITSQPRALRRVWARSRMGRRRHDKATGHRHARNGSRGDSQVCVECLC